MSYLSLLLASVTQGLSNTSTASHGNPIEGRGFLDTGERACSLHRGASEEYVLPSGIESLEHWLDLNA